MNLVLRVSAFASFALFATVACSSSEDGTKSNTGTSTGGQTACGGVTCSAGQHCDNVFCVNGCLTNDNCASDQTCEDIDTGSHIGTCKNKAATPTPPAGKDCTTFCTKVKACEAGVTEAQCQQVCTAASSECVACINDSNCGKTCDTLCGKE